MQGETDNRLHGAANRGRLSDQDDRLRSARRWPRRRGGQVRRPPPSPGCRDTGTTPAASDYPGRNDGSAPPLYRAAVGTERISVVEKARVTETLQSRSESLKWRGITMSVSNASELT